MENQFADFGIDAQVKRLTWLIGPPGAGKSTFAWHLQKSFSRIVEFDQMLGPLIKPHQITKGIKRANDHLIQVVRQIELIPENLKLPPLLAVAGVINPDQLLPLSPHEEIWAISIPKERWFGQLKRRPTQNGDLRRSQADGGYLDFDFAEKAYDQLAIWVVTHPETKIIETQFESDWLGKTHHELI
jgi:energy-coupling factor transporter ATP-binding protein EcfA2